MAVASPKGFLSPKGLGGTLRRAAGLVVTPGESAAALISPRAALRQSPEDASFREELDFEKGQTDDDLAILYGPAGAKPKKEMSLSAQQRAMEVHGVQEYLNSSRERIYRSTQREPLGKSYIRNHLLPEETKTKEFVGFGKLCEKQETAAALISPRGLGTNNEEARKNYIRIHDTSEPGEMCCRDYTWPASVTESPHFRFGTCGTGERGRGIKDTLEMDHSVGGGMPSTVVVSKTSQDFQDAAGEHLGQCRQLCSLGPSSVPPPEGYGTPSLSDLSAGELLRGWYSPEEQEPDADLGRSVRATDKGSAEPHYPASIPSIRYDLRRRPPESRSIADPRDFGDSPPVRALLHPSRCEQLGILSSEFSVLRPRAEFVELLAAAGCRVTESDIDAVSKSAGAVDGEGISLGVFLQRLADLKAEANAAAPLNAAVR